LFGGHNPAARLDRAAGELAVAFFDALESRQLLTNVAPTLASAFISPSTLPFLGQAVTITAVNAADSDGSIAQVRFYFDSNNDGILQPNQFGPNPDRLLGIDASVAGGWNLTVAARAALGFAVGANRVFAEAVDSDGETVSRSAVVNIGAANASPVISGLALTTPGATPIIRGGTVTFTASGITDADGTANAVEFYLSRGGDGTFAPAVNSAAGTFPRSVATSDFNGDGRPDLVVANGGSSNTVSILLANANGTFGTPVSFAVGTSPRSVAIADFNGDGRPDLAVANSGSDNVSILLGNGGGTFGIAVNFDVGDAPFALAVADFNGDGRPDLAVANSDSDNVSILLNIAGGIFAPAVNSLVGNNPRSLAVGDFNGDGRPDLAVATQDDNRVLILLGSASGTFPVEPNFFVFGFEGPRSVAVGDFNGDGQLDLAVANSGSDNVSIRLGEGDGRFGPSEEVAVGIDPISVAVGDFNGDGRPDLAVVNSSISSNNVSILLSAGNGTFSPAVNFAVGNVPLSVAIADFNGDGTPDLAVANNASNNLSLLLGNTVFAPTRDRLLGTVAVVGGSARITFSTAGLPAGPLTIFARPRDNRIAFGAERNVVFTVANRLPTIAAVTAVPNPLITLGATISLAATGVADADGRILLVRFYRAADSSNATFNINTAIALGSDALAAGGFTLAVNTGTVGFGFTTGINRIFAVAVDSDGAFVARGVVLNIGNNTPPVLGSLVALPSPVIRGSTATLTASGITDADGGSSVVEFYLSRGGNGTFAPAVNTALDFTPVQVAVGDFNRDGQLDLVTVNSTNDNVSILLGNAGGGGTFAAAVIFAVGARPQSVTIADFNGDGRLDLAVVSNEDNNVSILLGNGSGAFAAAGNFATGNSPQSVAVGDFNGDGRADLAVANSADANVSILLGIGDGAFAAAVNFTVGVGPLSVAVSDFNGDGRPDLAVANNNRGNVSILLGSAAGTFAPAVNFAVGDRPVSVVVGDFNGDGRPDLAVASIGAGTGISILLGRANGTFAPAIQNLPGFSTQFIAVGDFNGDGRLDLAATDFNRGDLSILPGNGNGTFGPAVRAAFVSNARPLVAGDFNGDGTPDIAVRNGGNLSILLGNTVFAPERDRLLGTANVIAGSATFAFSAAGLPAGGATVFARVRDNRGGFSAPRAVTFTVANRAPTIAAVTAAPNPVVTLGGTLNLAATRPAAADGRIALVRFFRAADSTDPTFNLATAIPLGGDSVAAGGFTLAVNTGTVGFGFATGINRIFAVAIDNNGGTSIAATTTVRINALPVISDLALTTPSTVPIIRGNRATFTASGIADFDGTANAVEFYLSRGGDGTFAAPVNVAAGQSPQSVAVADFNGDGRLDLAVANRNSDDVSILLGNAGGTFSPAVNFAVGITPIAVAVGDFNGDGRPDLAISIFDNRTIETFLGLGNGTFARAGNFEVGGNALSLAVSDFNGDGLPDLVTANAQDNTVSILMGAGNGAFDTAVDLVVGTFPQSVVVSDFNGDGRPDLAVANASSSSVSILLSNTNGTFAAKVDFAAGSDPRSVVVGDFNGDGRPDLAVANTNGNRISILLGNANGTFGNAVDFVASSGPRSVAVGDFNLDGRLDLAVANFASDNLAVFSGNGNGTFGSAVNFAVGDAPVSVTVGDFNGDGTPDLAVANSGVGNNVSTLLGNIVFAPARDRLLGTATVIAGSATLGFSTAGLPTGVATVFARARDNRGAFGAPVAVKFTVANRAPTIAAVTALPNPIISIGATLSLAATGLADADGRIAIVRFFRAANSSDPVFNLATAIALGEDSLAAGGFTRAINTSIAGLGFTIGTHRIFAVAIDNEGGTSIAATTTVRINARPVIGSMTLTAPTPAPILSTGSFTITLFNVTDDNSVTSIRLFRDSDGDGVLTAADTLLGTAVRIGVTNDFSFTRAGRTVPIGTYLLFAQATDSNGQLSVASSLLITVV